MVKDKKGKLGGIKSTSSSDIVKRAEAVSDIKKVKKTASIGKVKGAGRITGQKGIRTLSSADREMLRAMIDEEAQTLFSTSGFSKKQQETIIKAVKMAVDMGIIDEEEEEGT